MATTQVLALNRWFERSSLYLAAIGGQMGYDGIVWASVSRS